MAESIDPSKPSAAYTRMAEYWEKARALLGGRDAMTAAGEKYLPKMDGESQDNYDARLAMTFLFPGFVEGVNAAIAKPLSRPVTLGDKAPDLAKEIAKNVDLQGSSLNVFARRFMAYAATKGMAHILVSYPGEGQVKVTAAGSTVADQKAKRAHFELVAPEDLLAAYTAVDETGVATLSHARIRETTTGVDPVTFAETTVEKVRVYEPGKWTLWAKSETGGEWRVESSGVLAPPAISLVTLMWGERLGPYEVRPYFADLADKNVEHWQVSSHEKNAGTQSCFAMLVVEGAGIEDVKGITVGPKQMIAIPGDGSGSTPSLRYIEPTGTGIKWAADKLAAIMDEMNRLALKPLMSGQQSGGVLATARAIDETHANSEVQAFALAAKSALQEAFRMALAYSGQEPTEPVPVNVNTEFTPITAQEGGDLLLKARATGDLSRRTFWEELKRRSVLSDAFDAEEEAKRIEQDKADGQDFGDPNAGAP